MLDESTEDLVALSQEANAKINESIEDDPELGLVLSPPPKRKSGGSIAGQVSRQQLCREQLLQGCKLMQRMRSPCYTANAGGQAAGVPLWPPC